MKLHLDLHIGNMGFRVNDGVVQAVVYDAGQFMILDSISELERDKIRKSAISLLNFDVLSYFKLGVKPEYVYIYEKFTPPGTLDIDQYQRAMEKGVVQFLSYPDHMQHDSFIFIALLQFKCIGTAQLRNEIYDKKLVSQRLIDDSRITLVERDLVNYLFDPIEYNMKSWLDMCYM